MASSSLASFHGVGWLDHRGSPYTEAMKVTERFRRVNYGRLEIEVHRRRSEGLYEAVHGESGATDRAGWIGADRIHLSREPDVPQTHRPRASINTKTTKITRTAKDTNHDGAGFCGHQGGRRHAGPSRHVRRRHCRDLPSPARRRRCSSSRAGALLLMPSATSTAGSVCQTTPLIGWPYWPWTRTRTSLRPGCRVAKSSAGLTRSNRR